MGGEHHSVSNRYASRFGSSPRGRGTHRRRRHGGAGDRVIPAWAGNTLPTSQYRIPPTRVIPAWAGNTCGGSLITSGRTGHPRVGGEHVAAPAVAMAAAGSSPRGRGTQHQDWERWIGNRVIPAWAGNTTDPNGRNISRAGHPRVGGEHIMRRIRAVASDGSSPRGRGTRWRCWTPLGQTRVIPAWAGNTRR